MGRGTGVTYPAGGHDKKIELYRTGHKVMNGMRSVVVKKYETAKKFKRVIVNGRGANNKSQVKRRALK